MKYTILLLILFKTLSSFACDCLSQTVKEEYYNSDLIIKGTVVKIELKFHVLTQLEIDSLERLNGGTIFNDTISFYEYTFRVENTIKSTNEFDTILVRSGARKSNCDIHFKENTTYLLYANTLSIYEEFLYPKSSDFPAFYSSNCSRTTENWRQEIELLEKMKKS